MAADIQQSSSWKYAKHLYFSLTSAAILYLLAIIATDERSHHDSLELILHLSIALPVIGIWFLAARGATRFKQYANLIRKSKDGDGLNYIADAMLWMVVYIVVLITISPVSRLFKDTDYIDFAVVASNHLPLLAALIASGMFYKGALKLNGIVPLKISTPHSHIITAGGVFVSVLFILYFYNSVPTITDVNGLPRFTLSVGTLIFTYALPHLVVWGLGIYACMSIFNYSLRVKGELYKRSFRTLYKGIVLVFLCTFGAQLIRASNISLEEFSLLLLGVYGLLVAAVYGFILIYRGAVNLHKIENI